MTRSKGRRYMWRRKIVCDCTHLFPLDAARDGQIVFPPEEEEECPKCHFWRWIFVSATLRDKCRKEKLRRLQEEKETLEYILKKRRVWNANRTRE